MGAIYLWSRSNHPWGRVSRTTQDPITGESVTIIKEGETDVLVVFTTTNGQRFALHIENKVSFGKFMPDQPELYAVRAHQWMGNPKYQSYTDFETVLVAPKMFYQRNESACRLFHRYIPHEDIAQFIPLFRRNTKGFMETVYNIFLFFEKGQCAEVGYVTHTFEGADEAAGEFLRERMDADLKVATRLRLSKTYT